MRGEWLHSVAVGCAGKAWWSNQVLLLIMKNVFFYFTTQLINKHQFTVHSLLGGWFTNTGQQT